MPGDAVFVKASDLGGIYVNPVMLEKFYTLKDGKLIPKEGVRSIESLVGEELKHLRDLQVINYVLEAAPKNKKGKGKVGRVTETKGYLVGIWNSLSDQQKRQVIEEYIPLNKTVTMQDSQLSTRGQKEVDKKKQVRRDTLSESQLGMEALRMITDGKVNFYASTQATAGSNTLFHNFWKGARKMWAEVFGTTDNVVEDDFGRRPMPAAIQFHLRATERYLNIKRTGRGEEVISKPFEFASSEESHNFLYVLEPMSRKAKKELRVVQKAHDLVTEGMEKQLEKLDEGSKEHKDLEKELKKQKKTRPRFSSSKRMFSYSEQGARDALAFAEKAVHLLTAEQLQGRSAAELIKETNGEQYKGGINDSELRLIREQQLTGKTAIVLAELEELELSEGDKKHLIQRGNKSTPKLDYSGLHTWADYVHVVSKAEAQAVFGDNAIEAFAVHRTHAPRHLINHYMEYDGLSKEEATLKATYTSDPGVLMAEAEAHYLWQFAQSAKEQLTAQYVLKAPRLAELSKNVTDAEENLREAKEAGAWGRGTVAHDEADFVKMEEAVEKAKAQLRKRNTFQRKLASHKFEDSPEGFEAAKAKAYELHKVELAKDAGLEGEDIANFKVSNSNRERLVAWDMVQLSEAAEVGAGGKTRVGLVPQRGSNRLRQQYAQTFLKFHWAEISQHAFHKTLGIDEEGVLSQDKFEQESRGLTRMAGQVLLGDSAAREMLTEALELHEGKVREVEATLAMEPPQHFPTREAALRYANSEEWEKKPIIIDLSEEAKLSERTEPMLEFEEGVREESGEGLVYMGDEVVEGEGYVEGTEEELTALIDQLSKVMREQQLTGKTSTLLQELKELKSDTERSTFRRKLKSEKEEKREVVTPRLKEVRVEREDMGFRVQGGEVASKFPAHLRITQAETNLLKMVLRHNSLEEVALVLDEMAKKKGSWMDRKFKEGGAEAGWKYTVERQLVGLKHLGLTEGAAPEVAPEADVEGLERALALGVKIEEWRRADRPALLDIVLRAMNKVRTVANAARRGTEVFQEEDEGYGASMDENPEAQALAGAATSDTITPHSPVSIGGWGYYVNKFKVFAPGDWSAVDALRNSGVPVMRKLADRIDTFYDTELALSGQHFNGREVLNSGGVELRGVDQHGRSRGRPMFLPGVGAGKLGESMQAPGAFFLTEEQAQEFARRNGWKRVDALRQVDRYTKKELKWAEAQVEQYFRMRERVGKFSQKENEEIAENYLRDKGTDAAQDLVAWVKNEQLESGYNMKAHDVMVTDSDGTQRELSAMFEKAFPRVFTQETWEVINNPADHPEKYNKMLKAMVTHGHAKDAEDARFKLSQLLGGINSQSNQDWFANVDKARGWKLPDEFYDTSMASYTTYLRRYTNRMAQIAAFGQDGTVWDVAASHGSLGQRGKAQIKRIQAAVYRTHSQDDPIRDMLIKVGLSATAITYLSGPLTALRNTTFAMRANAESFGGRNTLAAGLKGLLAVVKQNAATLKRDGELSRPKFVGEAASYGLIQSDWIAQRELNLGGDEIRTGGAQKLDAALSWTKQYALWMQRTTEEFNRGVTATLALQHLRKTEEKLRTDPEGKDWTGQNDTVQHVAMIERIMPGVDMAKLFAVDERGHWKPDLELRDRFVREAVMAKQYGYNIRQHPLYLESHSGRVLFQFQKWGWQRTRDWARNVWRPMRKVTTVTMPDGTVKKQRDIKPLVRNAFLMVAQGELYATLLMALFYDRERDEAVIPISVENDSMIMGLGDRLYKDMVYDGGFGIVTDYASFLDPIGERSARYKQAIPLNPPAWSLANELQYTIRDTIRVLTKEEGDLNAKREAVTSSLEKMVSRFPFVRAVGLPIPGTKPGGLGYTARRALGIEDYEMRVQDGRKDVRLLRTAAKKFARANGYEEELVWTGGRAVQTEKRELYWQLNEALLAGDKVMARRVRDRLVGDKKGKDRKLTLTGIKASVRSRQPILLEGKQPTDKVQREFLRWVKKELPEYEERINRIHKSYWRTAQQAGVK